MTIKKKTCLKVKKKSSIISKALTKTKLFLFSSPGYFEATDVNWNVNVGDSSASTIVCPMLGRRHQHVVQFNNPLGVQIVCFGFVWILRNVDKNVFQNLKKLKKMKS